MDPLGTLHRRSLLRLAALTGTGLLTPALAGCTQAGGRLAVADVARRPVGDSGRAMAAVADATSGFSARLAGSLVTGENLVCSPFSVLVALAMVREGAVGPTAAEIDEVLGLPGRAQTRAGLNGLLLTLAQRDRTVRNAFDTRARVSLRVANQLFAQDGYPWQAPFLEALAGWFGTGVRQVDFADAEASRRSINAWVSEQTAEKIPDLLPPGVIDPETTRLALVNALYVQAPWHAPLDEVGDRPFRTAGGEVSTPAVGGLVEGAAVRVAGATAARLPLAGRELALTVLQPDDDPASALRGWARGGLVRLLRAQPVGDVALTMPSFRLRTKVALAMPLAALGMPTAFGPGADLSGMTTAELLQLQAVQHEGFVAVDAEGLEAAAATAALSGTTSAPAEPVELVLDRPFLWVLHDVALAVPLMVGVVADPTADAA